MSVLEYIFLALLAYVSVMALRFYRQASSFKQLAKDDGEDSNEIFEEIPLACQEVDLDGVIRRANQKLCDLRGLQASEILGKHYADFAPDSEADRVRNETHRKLAGEATLAP